MKGRTLKHVSELQEEMRMKLRETGQENSFDRVVSRLSQSSVWRNRNTHKAGSHDPKREILASHQSQHLSQRSSDAAPQFPWQ